MNTYVLAGWCFAAADVWLATLVDGRYVPAYLGLERQDVARHFKDMSASHSGFVARFKCPPGIGTVALVCRVGGNRVVMAEHIPVQHSRWKTQGSASKVGSYQEWIDVKEPQLSVKLLSMKSKPLVSVVLETLDTPSYYLRRSIESMLEQHYQNWQLCVADAGSSVQEFARLDRRIQLTQTADADLLVSLRQGDELHPDALWELVRTSNQFPEAKLFYSDEDQIDFLGVRSKPYFKPDYDKNIQHSLSYPGQMTAFKGERSDAIAESHIKHIRRPLYHRRIEFKPPTPVPVRRKAPKQASFGVFIRAADGVFQESIIRVNSGGRACHLYSLPSSAEIDGDVLVFINGPLESLSHFFFEDLISHAMKTDCGGVTGISLDTNNRILATGFLTDDKNSFWDPFVGAQFLLPGQQLDFLRSIDALAPTYFAVRRECIADIGGCGVNSDSGMLSLALELSKSALQKGLSLLFTPNAIATFSESVTALSHVTADFAELTKPLKLNPNIWSFEEPGRLLQGW